MPYDNASKKNTCQSGGLTGKLKGVAARLGIEACEEYDEEEGFYVFHVLVSNEDPNNKNLFELNDIMLIAGETITVETIPAKLERSFTIDLLSSDKGS